MARDNPRQQRQLGGELVIPILSVVFVLYFFTTIWNSPWTAQVSAFAVGGILMIVCAIFFARCLLWLRGGDASLGFANLFSRRDITSGRIGLFACTLGFAVFIDRLGFTLTTFLFLTLSMTILARGRRVGFIAVISAIIALVGWAVFIWAFDTRFPRGWFEVTMKALLSNG